MIWIILGVVAWCSIGILLTVYDSLLSYDMSLGDLLLVIFVGICVGPTSIIFLMMNENSKMFINLFNKTIFKKIKS